VRTYFGDFGRSEPFRLIVFKRRFGVKQGAGKVEYVEHYHHERNHQGLDNLIPFPYAGETKGRSGSVVKFERRTVPRAFGWEGCSTTIIEKMEKRNDWPDSTPSAP